MGRDVMDPNPQQVIDKLRKDNAELKRLFKLSQQQKRKFRKLVTEMRRGLIVSWKALQGDKSLF